MTNIRKILPKTGSEIDVKRTTGPLGRNMEEFFESFLPRRWMASFDPFTWKRPMLGLDEMIEPVDMRFDMIDRDRDLLVRVELPGVKKEDIEIAIAGEYLTIEAEREFKEEEQTENFFRSELGSGTLVRTVLLPVEVDPDKVIATLVDGILTIALPKVKAVKRHVVKVA